MLQHPEKWIYGIRFKYANGCRFDIPNMAIATINSDNYYIDIRKIARDAYKKECDSQRCLREDYDKDRYSSDVEYWNHINTTLRGITEDIEFIIAGANYWPSGDAILSTDENDIKFNALKGSRIDRMYLIGISDVVNNAIIEFITEITNT